MTRHAVTRGRLREGTPAACAGFRTSRWRSLRTRRGVRGTGRLQHAVRPRGDDRAGPGRDRRGLPPTNRRRTCPDHCDDDPRQPAGAGCRRSRRSARRRAAGSRPSRRSVARRSSVPCRSAGRLADDEAPAGRTSHQAPPLAAVDVRAAGAGYWPASGPRRSRSVGDRPRPPRPRRRSPSPTAGADEHRRTSPRVTDRARDDGVPVPWAGPSGQTFTAVSDAGRLTYGQGVDAAAFVPAGER